MNKQILLVVLGLLWGEVFLAQQPWNLKRCIDYAIAHNLTVKQQEADKEQKEVGLCTAKGGFLPDLKGGISHSFNFGRSLQVDNTYESLNTQNTGLNLTASIPLFTGLRTIHQVALAKLDLKSAIEDLEKVKEDISIQVVSAYLQVLFNQELAGEAHRQLELSREMEELKRLFFESGKSSKTDWYESRSRVAQDELSAVQADNSYKMSILELTQLLELPSPDGFSVVLPDVDCITITGHLSSPAEIYAEAVLAKSSIKAAQFRLEGAEVDIRIAQAAYYPQLSLGAGLGTNYFHAPGRRYSGFGPQLRDNFSQYVGLTLTIPIFNRFATKNQVRSARIRQETLNWKLEESKKNLYKEIQQAYYNALNAEAQFESSRVADEAAQAAFMLVKEKYQNGKAAATEYNESRTAWMKAVSGRIQAKYDYLFRKKILDYYRGIPLAFD